VLVSTIVEPGKPTSAGTSKDSDALMKTSKPSASSAGRAIRNVTCRSVESRPAPHMLAASSKDASEFRNTGDSRRKASGDHSIPSMKIIPLSE
jgi:hypothetical protein